MFYEFITYELKKIIFFHIIFKFLNNKTNCLYYFKILYFHMKINANDYDFRLFIIKYDLNVRYPGGMSAEKNSGWEMPGWNVGGEEFRM